MRPLPASELAQRMGAQNHAGEATITGFATDSSAVQPGDLFIAIKGARVDGHDFAPQALASGAVAALVERPVDGPHLQVSSVVDALASFGRSLRDEFSGPVVGLTGSAGKTTTKEFLAAALSPLGPVVKTQGNRNTEYTSPLLWVEVTGDTKAVVVELAMRGFGQIAHLAQVSNPTVGLITNIGYSHLLQVGDRAGIARAKGELLEALPEDAPCLLPADDDYLEELKRIAGQRPVLTFGFAKEADCRIESYRSLSLDHAEITGHCRGETWNLTLPSAGRHLATNASAAILAAHVLGVSSKQAAAGIADAELPPMRMETREQNGATILLDAYNAAPPSVLAALKTLIETPVQGRRLAVLGEMRELGEATESAHRAVGAMASTLDDALFVGETAPIMQEAAGKGQVGSLDDVRNLINGLRAGDVLLIKGSRALELEKALD
ncbi:UDP-N-acetylmuramoyl-tripeptide--D-alanyl-D-alanine ligase [bacterium]|nr:MAG: UDP-N-acetylmuramoyl-tripeptide--D-alanyl-D-alanine ligase [bacterium]